MMQIKHLLNGHKYSKEILCTLCNYRFNEIIKLTSDYLVVTLFVFEEIYLGSKATHSIGPGSKFHSIIVSIYLIGNIPLLTNNFAPHFCSRPFFIFALI